MNDLTVKDEGKPLVVLSSAFDAMVDRFENILPDHVSPQRFKQVVMTAIASSSSLAPLAATPAGRQSIIMASLKCASDGLVPDGREAALVPFKGTAAYLPMVRGIVTRMQQSAGCKEIGVNLVHEKDEFHYAETEAGTEFRHKPVMFGEKGELIGAYAFMRTADGGFYIAPVPKDELEKIEKTSKANDSPWKGPFKSEMQKKSALKRLAKIAPVSREVQAMIDHDNETFHEIVAEPAKPKMLDRLRAAKSLPASEAPETPEEPETPPTDEPDVMEGEIVESESETAPALPELGDRVTKGQAEEYAKVWAALYKPLDKAGRDALWAKTEDDVDRIGRISNAAMDICNDALNTPVE